MIMANLNVSVIPATVRSVQSGGQLRTQKNIRVAAYCRVSTGDESQQTSYTTQKAFYTDLITNKSGWCFAGIYADEALSGTSRARRIEFNRMMEDAKAGRLDYIVSKSISRFARNTVDTLTCIRELRQLNPPVGVYFEKENIDTLDATGELILTILSALAQDESRSISDNIRWAFQRNFQAGKPQINLNRMIGYDMGENGEWIINLEQAEIVRYIFHRFVSGQTANKIAGELNAQGKKTVNGKKWSAGGVLIVLRNEKYVGDLEMQKTITKDFLSHRSSRNNGEAPRYYIKNHHVSIIDRFTWEKAQAMLHEKTKKENVVQKKNKAIKGSVFKNLVCGEIFENGEMCGSSFFRITYTGVASGYKDERCLEACGVKNGKYLEKYSYSYPVWRCKRKKASSCFSELYHEVALEQSFMEMLYRVKRDYEENGDKSDIFLLFKKVYNLTCQKMKVNTDDLKKECEILENEWGILGVMKKNFEFFIECVKHLPETNTAGMKIKVNGLDVCGTLMRDTYGNAVKGKTADFRRGRIKVTKEKMTNAPDLLHFEKGIYCAFVEKGKAVGDIVEYKTNFGVNLVTLGNRRTLSSFLGYKKCTLDGNVSYVEAPYQVYNYNIQYRRYLTAKAKKELGKENS